MRVSELYIFIFGCTVPLMTIYHWKGCY